MQGPLVGDHMANGRVEMVVREVQRQCRTRRTSAEQNTTMIEQEHFFELPRMELCEAKAGQDRQCVAWESTNLEGLRHSLSVGGTGIEVSKKSQLTKKVDLPLPRIVVERAPEVDPEDFIVFSADVEARGHTGGFCRLCGISIAWTSDKAIE